MKSFQNKDSSFDLISPAWQNRLVALPHKHMSSAPKIRGLAEHEWTLYKDLRLAELAESAGPLGASSPMKHKAPMLNELTDSLLT